MLGLRHARRADIIKAMQVKGRETSGGLHFLSNYAEGSRWGSGSVNFMFDADGRVVVISASLDPPSGLGMRGADFTWNAELLPEGCSDLPGSRLKKCNP